MSPGSRILGEKGWEYVAGSYGITPRELEVVQLMFDDMCEVEISHYLGCSHHTVHTHIERIYRRLGVHSRLEMALVILKGAVGATFRRLEGVS